MAFTLAEETLLKTFAVKLAAKEKATLELPTKQLAFATVLKSYQAEIDANKQTKTDGNMKTETIAPEKLATIKATYDSQIAAAEADLKKTLSDLAAPIA